VQLTLPCGQLYFIPFGLQYRAVSHEIQLRPKTEALLNTPIATPVDSLAINRPILKVEAVTNPQSPMEYKLGTASQVLRKYAALLVLPYPLSFYYGYIIIDLQSVFDT
jgi:hypothetical protein